MGSDDNCCKKCLCTVLRCLLKCMCEPEPEPECETAYAKAEGPLDTCFVDLGFGNWGWTNGPITPGYTGTWPVWAAAGQCDTANGHLAGHLVVSHDGEEVSLQYQAADGCCITEQQIYIGADQLPTGPNGQPTTAPGQFPHKEDFAECANSSFLAVPADGPVYVIFHAVACCNPNA